MAMSSVEEIEARLARLEAQIRALKEAKEAAENEKKNLLLAWQGQRERVRAQLLVLRQKVEGALSHGRGDTYLDPSGASLDCTGVPRDDSAAGPTAGGD